MSYLNVNKVKKEYKNKIDNNNELFLNLLESQDEQEKNMALTMLHTDDVLLMIFYSEYIDILADYFKLKTAINNNEIKKIPIEENLYIKTMIELIKIGLNGSDLDAINISPLISQINPNTVKIKNKAIINYHELFFYQYDKTELNNYIQKELGYICKTEKDKKTLTTIINKAKTIMNKTKDLDIAINSFTIIYRFPEIMKEIFKYSEAVHDICEYELANRIELRKNK